MEVEYTLEALYDRIRKAMFAEKCTVNDAILAVHKEIGQDPEEVVKWWTALGPWWLKMAEDEVWKRGGPSKLKGYVPQAPAATSGSAPRPLTGRSVTPRPSWRANVNPLDMVLPVGDTGEKKRLGSFTRTDMLAMRDHYRTKGRQLIEEGDRWEGVAEQMGDDQVLEDVIEQLQSAEGILPTKLKVLPAVASA